MDEINQAYLLDQFRLIEEYLRRARGIAYRTREEYLSDPILVDASVRQVTVRSSQGCFPLRGTLPESGHLPDGSDPG
jgi:hypothetical protein